MRSTTDLPQPFSDRAKVQLLNLKIDRADRSEVLARVEQFVTSGEPHHIVTANLQFLSIGRMNPQFAEVVNDADLVVADGKPLLWISSLKGAAIASRITGHDLLDHCARMAHEQGYSIFLLGGAPGAADDAVDQLRRQYPGLRIAGTQHGHFSENGVAERQEELSAAIRDFAPHFLFVALGCLKQENWINRHMHQLRVPVCIGVGGTFEVFTGRLARAPMWMQRFGLEWAYRLKQEPGRLWKRYFLGDLPTVLAAVTDAIICRMPRFTRKVSQ